MQMPPPPPPMLQPYDPTRGQISCFTVNDHAGDNTISTATAKTLHGVVGPPRREKQGFMARRSVEEQAGRYLIRARADLATVVLLVEHELYAARRAAPDPRSGRTRISLQLAAKHVNYPWPDHLVSLATSWLPRERLEMLATVLRNEGGSSRLTVHDAKTILYVLRCKDDISDTTTISPLQMLEKGLEPVVEHTTTCADLGHGRIAYTTVVIVQREGDHIASLRRPQDMNSTDVATTLCPPQDSPALALLPSHAARHYVRGVLLAGNCYGPMDPVSNIVLSALWYDANFPLPDADRRKQVYDITDALTMLRAVSRSLRGLVALLHAISGQKLPLHEILKYLCYTQCDLSVILQAHLHQDGSSPNPFTAAATAGKHPQAYSMAAFFASLAPTKLDRLRSLMMSATANNAPLSQESLTQIYSILRDVTLATTMPWQSSPPKLGNTALSILASRCYYGPNSARKIVYPDHSNSYFSSDITQGGLDDTEATLEIDFLYFDSERDVEVAKELQRIAKQQDVMQQRWTTGRMSEWRMPAAC
ncbi:hypothetical protein QYE76_037542 [Lolium multiflorum]|uniref:PIR2-like helical domain-containing protein n=1 Tax=Lolium multiflorum TaxID=4521 RepID=A0AAD8QHQ4_LOLMU|nr:hypothetical protein QYE76_037542 [Lolium multiflorum]